VGSNGSGDVVIGFEESVMMPNDGEVGMVMGDLHRMSFTLQTERRVDT
jgi:hypothetical protein